MALSFFSRMVGPYPALSSRPVLTASLITLFRPWAVGLVLPTSRTFARHQRPWCHSLLISSSAQSDCDSVHMGSVLFAWMFFGWWHRLHVISVHGPFTLKAPLGLSLGGCCSQSCRGCLCALLRTCGSRLVASPGITAHFGRNHLQPHLLAMSLNVAKCNLG